MVLALALLLFTHVVDLQHKLQDTNTYPVLISSFFLHTLTKTKYPLVFSKRAQLELTPRQGYSARTAIWKCAAAAVVVVFCTLYPSCFSRTVTVVVYSLRIVPHRDSSLPPLLLLLLFRHHQRQALSTLTRSHDSCCKPLRMLLFFAHTWYKSTATICL